MITLFRSDRIYSCHEIRQSVVTQVRQLPRMISAIGEVRTILRFEFDCEAVQPLTWLHNQQASQKIYWSDRTGTEESAGILAAKTVQGQGPVNYHSVFDALDESLSMDNERIRFYGGFCFDHQQPAGEWDEFGSYRFIIPRFELNRAGGKFTFAVHICVAEITPETIDEILRDVECLDFSRDTQYRNVPRKLSRVDYPS
ncbi:MAG: hypothetical protein K8I00_11410, partial [Candidatus Omnitrophica bacterium]|nr:hypothetical protein [Candidatus Omnitrophota bacterium]